MVKNSPISSGDTRDVGSSLGQEDLLEEGMAIHPEFLPRKSIDRGAWRLQSMTKHALSTNQNEK